MSSIVRKKLEIIDGEQEECQRPDDGGVEGGQERANGGVKELPSRGLQVLGAPPNDALVIRREQTVEADGDDTRQADVAELLGPVTHKPADVFGAARSLGGDPQASIDPSLLLYPSFLKRMRTPELHQVWYLAGDAVRAAKRVVVIGYSLLEADAAI